MWRAMFLGLGAYACLLGVECLLIDKAVLAKSEDPPAGFAERIDRVTGRKKEIVPPDWAPWSLLSAGAVTVLYSFTIPRKPEK